MRAGARVVFLAGLLACAKSDPPAPAPSSPAAPVAAAPIATDQPRYTFVPGEYGPEVTIETTFTPSREVHLVNCNGAITTGIQRREGEAWVNAWIAETNGCLSPPIVVSPGARHTVGMTVIAGRGIGGPIAPGTYRAAWFNVRTASGEELPLEERVSAPFTLEAGEALREPITPATATAGSTILGMRVVSSTLAPAQMGGHVGSVRFAGEVTVEGKFGPHFEADAKEPCFFVDPLSASRLPRLATDVRRSWFCFTNPDDVRKAFGSPPEGLRAKIRIADFHYVFEHSDVVNAARFVRRD